MSKKINNTQSALLEGQVKEFIGSAKTKIADLKRDITLLEKEKEEANKELDDTRQHKMQVLQENQGGIYIGFIWVISRLFILVLTLI